MNEIMKLKQPQTINSLKTDEILLVLYCCLSSFFQISSRLPTAFSLDEVVDLLDLYPNDPHVLASAKLVVKHQKKSLEQMIRIYGICKANLASNSG